MTFKPYVVEIDARAVKPFNENIWLTLDYFSSNTCSFLAMFEGFRFFFFINKH